MPAYAPFQEWVIQLISMISSILMGVAAIYAIASLWAWRREQRRRVKLELARRIILLALQFQDEFHGARSLLAAAEETANRNRISDELPAESIVLDEWYVHNRRIEALQATVRELREATMPITKQMRDTIYGVSDDPFAQTVINAVNTLKDKLKPHVR
jgi:hypothetical protein